MPTKHSLSLDMWGSVPLRQARRLATVRDWPPLHGSGAVMAGLAVLVVVACLVNLNLGSFGLSPLEVLRTLVGQGTDNADLVVFQFRMPRIVVALLVGAGLAVSGGVLQTIVRNGLADPGLLGINAGASLSIVAYFAMGWRAYSLTLPNSPYLFTVVAFTGGSLAALVIFLLALRKGGITPSRLILTGVALGFGIGAVQLLLALRMDPDLYTIALIRLTGSLVGTTWTSVLALLPWVALLVPFAVYKGQVLNVLNLGDLPATGLGIALERERRLLIAAAVALASACVAVGGGIAFVGLIGPHIARRLVGPRHQMMLPTAVLAGMALLIVADTLARNLLPAELPVGAVVAIIGAPYFIYLLMRTRG
jgi:iron complex transport system permease protein